MKARARLEVLCADRGVRARLLSDLTPDNEGGPRGLRILLGGTGARLEIAIEAESPATAVSTSLAFLRDIALFEEVWLLSQRRRG